MRASGMKRSVRWALALGLLLGGAMATLGPGAGAVLAAETGETGDPTLAPRLVRLLERLAADDSVPVIVTTTRAVDALDEEDARTAGASVGHRFALLNGYSARVPAGSLRNLARGRNVARISYDFPVRSFNDLNYVTVGADLAASWSGAGGQGLDGSGVTVAVVDSGIADHPDLAGRQLMEVEIVGREKGFADYYGHGTHVAGIIAGDGSSSAGSASFRRLNGIAPRARLVSVRVLDAEGGGRVSDVLAGIDWVVAHRQAYGIRVMNLSLGHPVDEPYAFDPLCQAVERAWKEGIVVVAAAGNAGATGYASIHSPGNDPLVITVGASNNYRTASRSDDLLTTYTSRGPTALDHVVKPDLVAPGNRTLSLRAEGSTLDTRFPELRVKQGTYRDDPASADLDSPYFQLSGSSMAAGVVSGMAALMIQADPSITPDTLKARLMKSAEKRLDYDIFAEGAGFADLEAALDMREVVTGSAVSPTVAWTEAGIALQNTGDLWQDATAWGSGDVWGFDPLRGTGGVWADPAVWVDGTGDTTASPAPGSAAANSIIWGGGRKATGSSIIWGGGLKADSIIWGGGVRADSIIWGGGLKADSIIWGGGVKADSIIWGGGVSADSIIWGGGVTADSIIWGGGARSTTDPTLEGDNLPATP